MWRSDQICGSNTHDCGFKFSLTIQKMLLQTLLTFKKLVVSGYGKLVFGVLFAVRLKKKFKINRQIIDFPLPSVPVLCFPPEQIKPWVQLPLLFLCPQSGLRRQPEPQLEPSNELPQPPKVSARKNDSGAITSSQTSSQSLAIMNVSIIL